MNAPLAIAMLLLGGLLGWFGWWRATKFVYRRSMYDEDRRPPGINRRDYERHVIRRRKLWRLVATILHALVGAALGAASRMLFPHQG
jgi:hypothetical protein